MSLSAHASAPAAPGRVPTLAMAAAAGLAVANIYYNQPMLGMIAADFPGSAAAGMIPTATQLGYALGLFLLTPLGDAMDRRRLILIQFAALAATLAAAALAPTALTLALASLLMGAAAAVAQQIVPFAAQLATDRDRGRTIGTVMAGLLAGILVSRALAGFVATHEGWRAMFALGAPMALSAALLMAVRLPRSDRKISAAAYAGLLASLRPLWREEPRLRRAALAQAALFASFSAFWTILALRLAEPVFALGADAAGLFGLVGAAGVLAAPLAGRMADRLGPERVVRLSAGLAVLSWGLLWAGTALAPLIVGVVLLDFGVQGALVANQHILYALRPEARSRLNTLFMTAMFLGGAAGSAAAALAWDRGGWNAVAAIGVLAGLLAVALTPKSARRKG